MSDARAIAAISSALGQVVGLALHQAPNLSAAAELRIGRPVTDANFVGANLNLFRVTPNGARRNDDLATRTAEGLVRQRPRAAVDLEYLISFHGDESRLEPQRMMGAVMAALHAEPVLSAERIRALVQAAHPGDPLHGAHYDVDAPPVNLTLAPLESEALHRIWSLFPQSAYGLSLAYVASPALVDADLAAVRALPARRIVAGVDPKAAIALDLIPSTLVAGSALLTLVTRGAGDGPAIARLTSPEASAPIVEVPVRLEGGRAICALPPGMAAGRWRLDLQSVPAERRKTIGSAVFAIQPRLADGALWRAGPDQAGGTIVCAVTPSPLPDQPAELSLWPIAASPQVSPQGGLKLLRTLVAGDHAAALDRGEVRGSVEAMLPRATTAWTVTGLSAGVWRLGSGPVTVRAVQSSVGLILYSGLDVGDPDNAVAFAAPSLAPGEYLLSVAYGPSPSDATPLRFGAALFTLPPEALADLEAGRAPDGLSDLAARGIDLVPDAAPRRAGPQDGWEILGPDGVARVWVRPGRPLTVFSLDDQDGRYFGPSVIVPPLVTSA